MILDAESIEHFIHEVVDFTPPFGSTAPLIHCTRLASLVSLLVFVVAEITGNWSQVDRLWSILPVAHALLIYTWQKHNEEVNTRLNIMLILHLVWGSRLTYNYWRKGGYQKGEEDYRWEFCRQRLIKPRVLQIAFNFAFIAIIQNAILMLIATPMIVVGQKSSQHLGWMDVLLSISWVVLFAIEHIADNTQWRYHAEKHAKRPREFSQRDIDRGFLANGPLWSRSRHPNIFAEISMWIVIYLFSVNTSKEWINWSGSGCLLIFVLLNVTPVLTEYITAKKYPLYKKYQKTVSRLIPGFGTWQDNVKSS